MDYVEDLCIDGRMLLKCILDVDWICLVENRNQWQTVMNMVMNIHILLNKEFHN
jgi:hypothetical protein